MPTFSSLMRYADIDTLTHTLSTDLLTTVYATYAPHTHSHFHLHTTPFLLTLQQHAAFVLSLQPTTGLSSEGAARLLTQLKKTAVEQQLTVIAVIHAPSITVFQQLDDVFLMAKGGMCGFHGHREDLKAWLMTHHEDLELGKSPAESAVAAVSGRIGDTASHKAITMRTRSNSPNH